MKCSPVFCVCFLLVLILPITYYGVVLTRSSAPPCRLNMHRPFFEYEYYQDGDVIIGGLISAHSHSPYYRDVNNGSIGPEDSPLSFSLCTFVDLEEYRSMIVMMFTIKEINNNPDLLPNVTLGYRIFSTCNDPMKTLGYAIKILSGEKEAPNYYCKGDGEVAAFIGDSSLPTNHVLAQLLSLYRYTQIVFASRT